jgi:multidrug efflux pump subunit AcrB
MKENVVFYIVKRKSLYYDGETLSNERTRTMLRLTEYFIKHPRVTHMVVFVVFLTGLLTAFGLQREEFPPIGMDILKISTIYPGASPEDVEINVTNKIETQLLEVENIKKLTSLSMENMSIVLAEVNTQAGDPEKTQQNIREALQRVTDLPASITQKPSVEELGLSNIPVLEVSLSGAIPEKQLRQYARELETRMQEVNGIRRISKVGYRKREIKVNVKLAAIEKNKISLDQIMQAVYSRNVRTTGGTVESYVSEKKILTLAEYDQPLDVKDVIVRSNYAGYQVRISDLAEIQDDFEEPRILYRGNGQPAIGMMITKQEKADSITLSTELKQVIHEFAKDLPEQVKVDVIYDYSTNTQVMLRIVMTNGVVGFLLVLLVMFVFLDVRSAFWSAFGIPFSILGGMILLPAFGLHINIITLMTMVLVLGIVVDDAIVVVERIYSLKQRGLNNLDACLTGVRQMVRPVSAAVITSVLAFAPILFIPGIMGDFMKTIPVVVMLVLGFSLLETIFFVPAHIMNVRPPQKEPKRIAWLNGVKTWYQNTLHIALRHRGKVIAGYVGLLAVVFTLAGFGLNFVLDEATDEDVFSVLVEAPQGTSLAKTAELIKSVEKLVHSTVPTEALMSYTTQIGHHDNSMAGISSGHYSNWGLITVYMIPAEQREIKQEEVISLLRDKGKTLMEAQGLQRLDVEKLSGLPVGKAVNVVFTSNQDNVREQFEKEVQASLRQMPGVSGIQSSSVPGKDEIRLKLDYDQMARVGLTALDVSQTVRTAFDGTVVTSVRREGEDIAYRVRLKNPEKFRTEGILELPIANHQGQLIKLKSFAHLEEHGGPSVLHHYRGDRSVTVEADVDDTIITSAEVNKKLREHFGPKVAAIPGLSMTFGGQEEEMMLSLGGFKIAFVVVVLSIYFILVVLFNSYLQPLLIMSIVPFAIIGVLITLMLHGLPLSFISMIGMLGLIGVVVNDTIVMISHLNAECAEKGKSYEVIVHAALDRFRPVVLTSLTTFAALLPTAYGIGGDLPQLRPMVLVMAWGLVFATIVTLGLIPLVYSWGKGTRK